MPFLSHNSKITDWAQEKAGILKQICKCGFILGEAMNSVRALEEDPWMWWHDEGRPQNSCGSDLVILAPKRRGWRDDPKEGYGGGWKSHRPPCCWIKNILPLSLSFPPSLSLSFFLFFLLVCFLSFLPGSSKIQLRYTISPCHRFIALLSQMYERLSDCPRSLGVYFSSHGEEGPY